MLYAHFLHPVFAFKAFMYPISICYIRVHNYGFVCLRKNRHFKSPFDMLFYLININQSVFVLFSHRTVYIL